MQFQGQVLDKNAPNTRTRGRAGSRIAHCAAMAISLCLATTPPVRADWAVTELDNDSSSVTGCSIALDPVGYPHVVYHTHGSYDMRYKYSDGSTWRSGSGHTSGDAGYFNCLAIGDDGTLHVSNQQRGGAADLYYLTRGPSDSSWGVVSVDSPGDVGTTSAIALGPDGQPGISYNDYTNRNLKYAWRTSSGWMSETVAPMGRSQHSYQANYSALAIDDAGFPHIVFTFFTDGAADDLKYAYKNSEGWQVATLDSEGAVGNYVSMTRDSVGGLHVAYADTTNGDLKYLHRDGAGWQPAEVVDADRAGYFTSIEVGSNDQPVIAYGGAGQVRVASKSTGSWATESADPAGSFSGYVDLAIGADDSVHVVYRYAGKYLRYSTGAIPVPLAPLEITSFTLQQSQGQALLSWTGPAGWDHVVYSSPDLRSWSELSRIADAPEINDLTIPLDVDQADTFYRVGADEATPP